MFIAKDYYSLYKNLLNRALEIRNEFNLTLSVEQSETVAEEYLCNTSNDGEILKLDLNSTEGVGIEEKAAMTYSCFSYVLTRIHRYCTYLMKAKKSFLFNLLCDRDNFRMNNIMNTYEKFYDIYTGEQPSDERDVDELARMVSDMDRDYKRIKICKFGTTVIFLNIILIIITTVASMMRFI